MTQKRKQAALTTEGSIYNAKRPRSSSMEGGEELSGALQPRIDPTYGQRGAFPGLDDKNETTLFYGPANDGLEYLRMVRSEAKGVPNLLVAPLSPTISANDPYKEYEQGYYADGAYTALPDLSPTRTCRNGINEVQIDPQEACYASLCHRFAVLSTALRLTPHGSAALSAFNPSSRASWRRFIVNMQPTSLILSKLRQEEVMHGLEVLETVLSMANLQRHKNVGLWAWGLLARCRDVGEMGSEEVGVLRDLGKKAIAVLRGVAAGLYHDNSENGENEDEDKGEEEPESQANADVDADAYANAHNHVSESLVPLNDNTETSLSDTPYLVEAAKQLLLKSLTEGSPGDATNAEIRSLGSKPACILESDREFGREEAQKLVESESPISKAGKQKEGEESIKMHATLDMIITIVGELYGQKDLLPGRLLWDEMETPPIVGRCISCL